MNKFFTLILLIFSSSALAAPYAVLVPGYHNEKFPTYFKLQKEVLKNRFHIESKIIKLRSENSIDLNASLLGQKLSSLTAKKEIIILAHSKGGLETLLAFIKNPNLLVKTKRIILMQSPLQGSPYADYYWNQSDQQNAFNWGYFAYSRLNYQGFLSMRSKSVKTALLAAAKLASKSYLSQLSKKVFYWRSHTNTAPASYDSYRTAIQDLGDNDGLVPSMYMKLDSLYGVSPFGRDLGSYQGLHHLELVAPAIPFSNLDRIQTKEILDSILFN